MELVLSFANVFDTFLTSKKNRMMGKRFRIRLVIFIIMELLLFLTNSCRKSDDITDNNISFPVYDIDGNVYSTLTIGTQEWMAENLKTANYNDGAPIQNVTVDIDWQNFTTGAYCWHNNDTSNKSPYGALYNWYAVSSGKLCPTGWHVPSNSDWTTLENYLITSGFNYDGTTQGNKIAKSLAATTTWPVSGTRGAVGNTDFPEYRNKTGFTALPGGMRSARPEDSNFGYTGYWWSSTQYNGEGAWYYSIYFDFSSEFRGSATLWTGLSVRCLKDK
jgi:uncharacterized protein (TIGR02145 family)